MAAHGQGQNILDSDRLVGFQHPVSVAAHVPGADPILRAFPRSHEAEAHQQQVQPHLEPGRI
jgi:hypothetical protein